MYFLSSAPPKRFYRKVNILQSDDKYEIILDKKKLKTPKGSVLKVENEALALAVATEWDSQKEVIQRSYMHLVRWQYFLVHKLSIKSA